MTSRFLLAVTSIAVACWFAAALMLVPHPSAGAEARGHKADHRPAPHHRQEPAKKPSPSQPAPPGRTASPAARATPRAPSNGTKSQPSPAMVRRPRAGRSSRQSAGGRRARGRFTPTPPSPASMQLTPAEQLGKNIFFDQTLSDPPGLSCATCHLPAAGFTGSSSSGNASAGPVPGVIPGRFGRRKPQAVAYAAFSPFGPFFSADQGAWIGGTFWDGRTPDLPSQARMPFLDPDEMANTPVGPYPPHVGGFSPLVAEKLKDAPYVALFLDAFGPGVMMATDADIYAMATNAIAAYEASFEVNPFSSKFDASIHGTPAQNVYRFNPSEQHGLILFFGKARCSACHSSAAFPALFQATGGKDVFTRYGYFNIGVPENPSNPFYQQTDGASNPFGYNPMGSGFVDYGLGANPNPSPQGTRFMSATPGDNPQFRGLFKTPTVRNVGERPDSGFVKAYMHNGVFKSLQQVVHFYNKRNIAVAHNGHERAFDLRVGPPIGYSPLFAPPEVMDNAQNVAGASPHEAGVDITTNGLVGNLGLSAHEEADLVAFLQALTDGFTAPNPVGD